MKNIILITVILVTISIISCSSDIKKEVDTKEAKEWISNVAGKKAVYSNQSYTFKNNGDVVYNDGTKDRMYIFNGAKSPNEGYYYEVINLKDTFKDYSNVKNAEIDQYFGFIINSNTITQSDFTLESMSNALYWIGNNTDFNTANWDNYPASAKEDVAWTTNFFPIPFMFTNN